MLGTTAIAGLGTSHPEVVLAHLPPISIVVFSAKRSGKLDLPRWFGELVREMLHGPRVKWLSSNTPFLPARKDAPAPLIDVGPICFRFNCHYLPLFASCPLCQPSHQRHL